MWTHPPMSLRGCFQDTQPKKGPSYSYLSGQTIPPHKAREVDMRVRTKPEDLYPFPKT